MTESKEQLLLHLEVVNSMLELAKAKSTIILNLLYKGYSLEKVEKILKEYKKEGGHES